MLLEGFPASLVLLPPSAWSPQQQFILPMTVFSPLSLFPHTGDLSYLLLGGLYRLSSKPKEALLLIVLE